MVFSFRFIREVIGLFLRYPASIRLVLTDFGALSPYIDKRVLSDYLRPIGIKRTRGFDIYLNPPKTDRVSAYIAVLGYWELAPTELFCNILKKGMTAVDVGANIGWFTMMAARLVGSDGEVFAFEPEESNFALLKISAERNKFQHVHLERTCVSDTDGFLTLFLDTDSGTHSTVRQTSRSVQVPCISLDSFFASGAVKRIDVLKVDVEGAEAEVLSGARKLISESKIDHMFLEWNPEAWISKSDLLQELVEHYHIFRIVSSSPFLIRPVETLDHLDALVNIYLRRKFNQK